MKIKELHIEKYKCFQEPLHLSFEDKLNGGILSRVLITGANGSGKTTILKLIINFLGFLGAGAPMGEEFLKSDGYLILEFSPDEISSIDFGSFARIRSNIKLSLNIRPDPSEQGIWWRLQDNNIQTSHIDTSTERLLAFLHARKKTNGQNWGGTVFFPHDRAPTTFSSPQRTIETPRFQWITHAPQSTSGGGSLYNYLRWLEDEDLRSIKYGPIQTHKFEDALKEINELLIGKKIDRIDESGRILVSISGKEPIKHPIEELSSGEKHLLLLLLEVSRRCWSGSILLIDEPEISLHPGMQQDLLFMLDKICKKRDIQLIMASHSETIFNLVYPHERIILSSLNERAVADQVAAQ